MAVGIEDLKQVIKIPTSWDLAYMQRFNNEDNTDTGIKFDELTSGVGAALLAFNQELLSPSDYYSRYLSTTLEAEVEYDTGGSSDTMDAMTEHAWPDPTTSESNGHMIPRKDYAATLAWSYLALRRAPKERLIRNVRSVIEKAQNTWDIVRLTRLFSNTADTVGATGKSVPFADGGAADNTYVPQSYKGTTFTYTHNHFVRNLASKAGRATFLQDGASDLREHGISGPYDLVIPEVDIGDWTELIATDGATFIRPNRGEISMASIAQRASIDEETYIGVIEIDRAYFYVKAEPRLSTKVAGIFRPLGVGSPGNPLLVRYEKGYPLGLALIAAANGNPFIDAKMMFTFGAGINNRISGYVGSFGANGAYTPPTIS